MAPRIERKQLAIVATFGRGDRPYYLCQVLGWGFYAFFLGLLATSFGQVVSGAVLVSAVWSGTGLVGTHVFRTYTKNHPWHTVPQLAIRLALAIVIVPAMIVAAQT